MTKKNIPYVVLIIIYLIVVLGFAFWPDEYPHKMPVLDFDFQDKKSYFSVFNEDSTSLIIIVPSMQNENLETVRHIVPIDANTKEILKLHTPIYSIGSKMAWIVGRDELYRAEKHIHILITTLLFLLFGGLIFLFVSAKDKNKEIVKDKQGSGFAKKCCSQHFFFLLSCGHLMSGHVVINIYLFVNDFRK